MNKATLKKRIKRALANFLKDELLEFIGYERNYPPIITPTALRVRDIDFNTITTERLIELSDIMSNQMSDPSMQYEIIVDRMKKELFNEVEKCIHVETFNLTSPEYRMRRSIRMTLRVQKPQI